MIPKTLFLLPAVFVVCSAFPSQHTRRSDGGLPPQQHREGSSPLDNLSLSKPEQPWRALVQTYLATLNDLGIETWLMHSTLLGWSRDRHVIPDDPSLSMQVSEPGIFFLAAYYNMSTFYFKTPEMAKGRRYLFQLSPHARDRERPQQDADTSGSPADARWIDTESGLSLDVYAVRYNLTHPAGEGMLSVKDGNELMDTYLFPLQKTTFEGVPARVPFRYRELLVMEYGRDVVMDNGWDSYRAEDDKTQLRLGEELPDL